jgi:hypothetical protein
VVDLLVCSSTEETKQMEANDDNTKMMDCARPKYERLRMQDRAHFDNELHKYLNRDDVISALEGPVDACHCVENYEFSVGGNNFMLVITDVAEFADDVDVKSLAKYDVVHTKNAHLVVGIYTLDDEQPKNIDTRPAALCTCGQGEVTCDIHGGAVPPLRDEPRGGAELKVFNQGNLLDGRFFFIKAVKPPVFRRTLKGINILCVPELPCIMIILDGELHQMVSLRPRMHNMRNPSDLSFSELPGFMSKLEILEFNRGVFPQLYKLHRELKRRTRTMTSDGSGTPCPGH